LRFVFYMYSILIDIDKVLIRRLFLSWVISRMSRDITNTLKDWKIVKLHT